MATLFEHITFKILYLLAKNKKKMFKNGGVSMFTLGLNDPHVTYIVLIDKLYASNYKYV